MYQYVASLDNISPGAFVLRMATPSSETIPYFSDASHVGSLALSTLIVEPFDDGPFIEEIYEEVIMLCIQSAPPPPHLPIGLDVCVVIILYHN